MSKELALFKDFWDSTPSSVFNRWDISKKYPDDFKKILEGKCDFEEMDDSYEIELEVPGVKKKEIEIDFKNDYLTISWSRKREKKSGLRKKTSFEISEGNFKRSFTVSGADAEKITAELKFGTLKIHLPKKDDFKPKRIQIL